MPRRSVTPFLRGRTYSALIPRPSGRGKGRSLGTADVKTAEKISRFLMWLREQGEWYLLDKLADGSANPTEAFAAHTLVNLPTYIQTLKNGPIVVVDIEPYVKKWIAEMKRIRSPADDTRKRYVGHVRTLLPDCVPFPLERWTKKTIRGWLTGLGIDSTNRQRASASSFAQFLIDEDVCEHNPARAVTMSREADPRRRYLSQDEAKAVIGAMSGLAKVYHALCAATGMEKQAAFRLRYCDVDVCSGTMLADGKKTTGRARTAAQYRRWSWAWTHVVSHMTQTLGADRNALVFEGLGEWGMYRALKDACATLGIEDYHPHDWRHTWAVQAIRDSLPLNTVAAQLGHKDAVMTLRIYGKFVPVAADFERVNAAIEAEEARAAGMLSAIDQAIAQGKPIDLSVLECTRLETDCGTS